MQMPDAHYLPQLMLLNVGHAHLLANWNWREVSSPFARLYYVSAGHARLHIYNKVYLLRPGHLYLIPPFARHDDECSGRFSLYYVHFYELPGRHLDVFSRFDFPVQIASRHIDGQLVRRLLQLNPGRHLHQIDPRLYDNMPTFARYVAANRELPLHAAVETQGILQQLLARFIEQGERRHPQCDERISRCITYIHTHTHTAISIRQLANVACLSEDYLTRLFRTEMGTTPVHYVNARKMERAQLMLITTELPIGEIALELAIDNVSYFNRLFRRFTGKTPGEYREGEQK